MWKTIIGILAAALPALLPLFNKRVSKPKNHKFFGEIARQRKYVIPTIELSHNGGFDKGRTLIFRDMLIIKFKVWQETMSELAKRKKCRKVCMLDAIDDLVNSYNRQWIEQGVPKIVIDKFNGWHSAHAKNLVFYIESIMDGNSFSSNGEKMNAVLYLHLAMMFTTMSDVEHTLGQLNGELSGLEYKGVKLK